jgi:hypothetical protein
MKETAHSDRTADPAYRRERGIEAYARIFVGQRRRRRVTTIDIEVKP